MLAFGLVGDQHHRLVGAPCKIGEGAVGGREAYARIDHEHQRIGLRDRGFRLLLHPRRQRALGALVETRGVDDGEGEIAELALALAAVAGDAGQIIDQRKLLPDQPVEQRRLADIGPADDGDRERHGTISSAGFAAPVNATGNSTSARNCRLASAPGMRIAVAAPAGPVAAAVADRAAAWWYGGGRSFA